MELLWVSAALADCAHLARLLIVLSILSVFIKSSVDGALHVADVKWRVLLRMAVDIFDLSLYLVVIMVVQPHVGVGNGADHRLL